MSATHRDGFAAVLVGCLLLLPAWSSCSRVAPGGGDDNNGELGAGVGDGSSGGEHPDLLFDNDAFFAKDPPPMYCGLDGGAFPPPKIPGGTPDCPDDKNREGCPCPTAGMTATCWPGLRKNRNLGICKDGTTSCQAGEVVNTWGPCMGYVLPVPGGKGKDACECFSGGTWALKNLEPCFVDFGGGPGSGGAISTYLNGGTPMCPEPQMPLQTPTQPWSSDTVKVDCEGHFKLCFTIKAGQASNPQPGDCTIVQVCSEANYTQVNMEQPFPDLPGWKADSPDAIACIQKFIATGGYGEMSVDGLSIMCDRVQKVFNRVTYCPAKCNDHPMDPDCKNCGAGGGGMF